MATVKLKKFSVDGLKAGDRQYYRKIEGMDGFFIRVTPSGVKTWHFIYRIDNKKKYMNLGTYPTVSLEAAKNKYNAAIKLWEHGNDPSAKQQQEKEDNLKAPIVNVLVNEYLERHAKRFKRSWQEDDCILNREIVPAWGTRKAADVSKRDVIRLLEGIVDRGSPAMANNTFQVVRKMFNYAVEKDLLPYTPCAGIKLPSPKVARDRTLSADEIRTMWANLDACAMSDGVRRALKLILITAQRPGEVAGIHTKEIDGRWWTIPPERAKNGKAQRVYLTDLALEIIGDTDGAAYIFPSPHKTKVCSIDDHALAVAVLRSLSVPMVDSKGNPLFTKDCKPATENSASTTSRHMT